MVETKRRNGTISGYTSKNKGKLRPNHSKFMRIFMIDRIAKMTDEQFTAQYRKSGIKNHNCRPKITLKSIVTGEIKSLYAFEWHQQYGVSSPQLSRVRHNRQDFIIDRYKNKWIKMNTEQ